MADYFISPAARSDIDSILDWTEEQFGVQGRLRYEELLSQAILDVADDPQHFGSRDYPELAAGAKTYHLKNSRDRVAAAIGRVRHPRHFLLYRIREDGGVEISRVLHDHMDIARHLPEEYRQEDAGEE
jgi:toxin ParE1/3/4